MNECIKNELIGSADDICLYYTDASKNSCAECKQGYAKDYIDHSTCKKTVDHCEESSDDGCYKCEQYYKVVNGSCERSTCSNYINGECQCESGFYNVDDENCKKIPIKYCEKGNANTCEECYEGYNLEGNQCKFVGYDDDDDDKEEEMTIKNCAYYSEGDNKKCGGCKDNYELDSEHNLCVYLCKETEEICDECNDNYFQSSSGNCEIIDPDYVEKDNAVGIKGTIYSNLFSIILLFALFY